jgi:hypothetical protein
MPGSAPQRATIRAVSSTDSVVWVTKASASFGWSARDGLRASSTSRPAPPRRRQLAHGADHLGMAGMADQMTGAAALVHGARPRGAPW